MVEDVVATLRDLGFLVVCLFFGNLALKGWRGRKDIVIRILGTIFLGLVCFVLGTLAEPLAVSIPIPFISGYLGAFSVAIIIYLSLFMISSERVRRIGFVVREELDEIIRKIDFLKEEVAKINKALIDKGVLPKPLEEEKAKEKLKEVLSDKGIKKFEVESSKFIENKWFFLVDIDKKKYNVSIDAYSGELRALERRGWVLKEKVMRELEFIYKNKRALTGVAIAVVFFSIILINASPEDWEKVKQRWRSIESLAIAPPTQVPEAECIGVLDLIASYNRGELVKSPPAKYDPAKLGELFPERWVYPMLDLKNNYTHCIAITSSQEIKAKRPIEVYYYLEVNSDARKATEICSILSEDSSLTQCDCLASDEVWKEFKGVFLE
jgi:hypothetical protein